SRTATAADEGGGEQDQKDEQRDGFPAAAALLRGAGRGGGAQHVPQFSEAEHDQQHRPVAGNDGPGIPLRAKIGVEKQQPRGDEKERASERAALPWMVVGHGSIPPAASRTAPPASLNETPQPGRMFRREQGGLPWPMSRRGAGAEKRLRQGVPVNQSRSSTSRSVSSGKPAQQPRTREIACVTNMLRSLARISSSEFQMATIVTSGAFAVPEVSATPPRYPGWRCACG